MTVCIAATCEGGKKIVSATDGLLTLGGVASDVLGGKMLWFHGWQISYAGSPGNTGLILEELRRIEQKDHKSITRERIQETIQNAYNAARAREVAHAVLGPLGITLEAFNKKGAGAFGNRT